jgi:hypothetical protein
MRQAGGRAGRQAGTNVKFPEDDTEMLNHVGENII